MCHRDLHPSNVLPLAAGGLAVLDWENLGPLWLEQELGCLLYFWCSRDAVVSAPGVEALLSAYGETTGATPSLSLDSFAVVTNSWLNFLALQVEAALAPDSDPEHLAFAESVVQQMLARPLSLEVFQALADATGRVIRRVR